MVGEGVELVVRIIVIEEGLVTEVHREGLCWRLDKDEQFPLLTIGTLGRVLNDCCPLKALSLWKGGDEERHRVWAFNSCIRVVGRE